MRLIVDLHIHGCYSQATSKNLTLDNLEKWARIKGVDLLGCGDFTHPKWIAHIKETLTKEKDGIYYTKSGFPFLLQTEISFIYSQGGRGRRIHLLVYAPNLKAVEKITNYLLTKGRVDYDGRPIFKIRCDEFVFEMKNIDKNIEIIPAHIWTPWFSVYGSKGGFDSLKECFGDQLHHIKAIETGLSSDPLMNWNVTELDNMQIVSFSDAHSFWPWRLGREATILDTNITYKDIMNSLLTGDGLNSTIEVDPNYGKYHIDGHRKCGIKFFPNESKKHNNICPVCKRELTLGVLGRIEELGDKNIKEMPKNRKPYHTLLPLHELISNFSGKGINTKYVWNIYSKIMELGKNEYDILLNTEFEKLKSVCEPALAEIIIKNRNNEITVSPGYDGEYGIPNINEENTNEKTNSQDQQPAPQKGLADFM